MNRWWHAVAVAVALIAAAVLAASPASARPGPAAEPVIVLPGFGNDCVTTFSVTADWPNVKGRVQEGVEAARAAALAAGQVVDPVPDDWFAAWSFSPCGHDFPFLARQLDRALADLQARTGADKVDIVGFSLGAQIARFCGTNAGGTTPDCAGRIDDLVGLSNASYGSRNANLASCLGVLALRLWSMCVAYMPGSLEIRRMNWRGPVSPGSETSMYWTPNDNVISPPSSSRIPGAANARTTSPRGLLRHAEMWDAERCPAMPEIVGRDLLDLEPFTPGDRDVNCAVTSS